MGLEPERVEHRRRDDRAGDQLQRRLAEEQLADDAGSVHLVAVQRRADEHHRARTRRPHHPQRDVDRLARERLADLDADVAGLSASDPLAPHDQRPASRHERVSADRPLFFFVRRLRWRGGTTLLRARNLP